MRPQVAAARESGWIPAGASVVDLGCGLGHTAAWLAARGHRVLALDLSRAAIRRARAAHDVPALTLRCADVSRPMRRVTSHDVVLDLGCLHQLPAHDLHGYRVNVLRLTRPGSRLLCLFRIRGDGRGAPTLDGRTTYVRDVLGPGFEIVSASPTETQPPEVNEPRPAVELRIIRIA